MTHEALDYSGLPDTEPSNLPVPAREPQLIGRMLRRRGEIPGTEVFKFIPKKGAARKARAGR